jgi:hypothetical protein
MLAMGAEIFVFKKKNLDGNFKSLQLCVSTQEKKKEKKRGEEV